MTDIPDAHTQRPARAGKRAAITGIGRAIVQQFTIAPRERPQA